MPQQTGNMNVLHLSSNLKFGGSEQQIINLIEAGNDRGIKNFVLCYSASDLAARADQIKGEVIPVPKLKPFSITLLRILKAAVKKHGIDIIHIHNGKFVLPYMLSCKLLGLRTPAVFSKKDMSRSSSAMSRIKYNFNRIRVTLCVTEAIKKRFQEILYPKNHGKLMVLRHGVNIRKLGALQSEDIHAALNVPPGVTLVGNVANHVRAKGLKTLVLTLDYLVNQRGIRNLHFVQIGRFTDLTDELKQMVSQGNLEPYITFAGFLKNGFAFTSQFDIFLMTSESEGFPQAALESFYYKVPVVSTRAGGIPEVITDGENGLLADVFDHKTLGDNIIKILKDQELREKLIKNSHELIMKELNSEVMTDKTIEVYKKVLENER